MNESPEQIERNRKEMIRQQERSFTRGLRLAFLWLAIAIIGGIIFIHQQKKKNQKRLKQQTEIYLKDRDILIHNE